MISGYCHKVYSISHSGDITSGPTAPSPDIFKKPSPGRVKGEKLSVATTNNFC